MTEVNQNGTSVI